MIVRNIFAGLIVALAATFAMAPLQPAQAADCNPRLLTAPAWYRGVTDGDCNISLESGSLAENPATGGKIGSFILVIGLNLVEILMHVVAYVAVIYIIVGGFKYMTSAGSADGSVKARKTITNAVIGLVISLVAITIITFIIGRITN